MEMDHIGPHDELRPNGSRTVKPDSFSKTTWPADLVSNRRHDCPTNGEIESELDVPELLRDHAEEQESAIQPALERDLDIWRDISAKLE